MEEFFRFKQFSVRNRDSALKVGTDAVLLGAAMTLFPSPVRIGPDASCPPSISDFSACSCPSDSPGPSGKSELAVGYGSYSGFVFSDSPNSVVCPGFSGNYSLPNNSGSPVKCSPSGYSFRRLLDVGTGTGVIALMAAQRLSGHYGLPAGPVGKSDDGVEDLVSDGLSQNRYLCEAPFQIDAIDVDAPSVAEAAWNFEHSPWSTRLSARCCPLQEFRPAEPYDLIFSNPPYYDNSLLNPSGRESGARHTLSLSYRDLCAFASENLLPDGRLSLILPADKEKELIRTAASFGLHPFRLLRIRTTAAKPYRRLIAEFSRLRPSAIPSGISAIPFTDLNCSSCKDNPAGGIFAAKVTDSVNMICQNVETRENIGVDSDSYAFRLIEEELTLQDGPSRTPAYAALTSDFYL